jgi:hypothetical protein
MKKIILFSILYFLFSTLITEAALVPCGREGQPACTWCDLMQLIKNVIDFLMYLVIPLSVIMIVIGGIIIMTAAGSTQRVSQGKEIVTAALIGLLIALLSWIIIDTILKIISTTPQGSGTAIIKDYGPWNKIKCNP